MVHEECLAGATLKAAEDPQKEGLLRYLIDYEEKHRPSEWGKEISGGRSEWSIGKGPFLFWGVDAERVEVLA